MQCKKLSKLHQKQKHKSKYKNQVRNSCKFHKHKHNRINERLDSPLGDVNNKHVVGDIIVDTVWRMEILMEGNQIWWHVV